MIIQSLVLATILSLLAIVCARSSLSCANDGLDPTITGFVDRHKVTWTAITIESAFGEAYAGLTHHGKKKPPTRQWGHKDCPKPKPTAAAAVAAHAHNNNTNTKGQQLDWVYLHAKDVRVQAIQSIQQVSSSIIATGRGTTGTTGTGGDGGGGGVSQEQKAAKPAKHRRVKKLPVYTADLTGWYSHSTRSYRLCSARSRSDVLKSLKCQQHPRTAQGVTR